MPRGHLALTRRSEMGRGRPANTKLSPRATVAVTSRHKSHIWEPHARAPAARPTDPPRPPALAELERTLAHAARGRRGPLTLTLTARHSGSHLAHKSHIWEPHARAPAQRATTRAPTAAAARPTDPPRPPALAELESTLAHAARGRRRARTLNSHRAPQWQSPRATKVTSGNHTRALQLSERRRARPPPPPPARATRRARPRSLSWRSRSRTPHADAGAL